MTNRMMPDNESPAVGAAPLEDLARNAALLRRQLAQDVTASRWRRLIGGVSDFVIALVLSTGAGAIASSIVELGTATSASTVLAVGWIVLIAYLASPWTLARRALGMRVVWGSERRGAKLIRGLIRVVLLPVNVVMLLVVNRHVGDMATATRVVRTRVSWSGVALIPVVIGLGYAGVTQAFLHAATRSDAWAKARQVIGTEVELRRFAFDRRSAVFESSWGYQELILLGDAWYVLRARQGPDVHRSSMAVQLSLAWAALTIGESRVSRAKIIDVSGVRTELIAKLAQQTETRGMVLRDVECDEFTGPTNECRAQVTKPGDQPVKVRIAIWLDDKDGMTGNIGAPK